ncbi:VC2046/SO_2500 family protein [Paraglaciecola aestuariivivens]
MSDSVLTQSKDIFNHQALVANDYELNGQINQAAGQGAKFALLMAMLEQDSLHRPQFDKDQPESSKQTESIPNYYRNPQLSADASYWQSCESTRQFVHQAQMQSAKLWLAMHPEPLALNDKVDTIDPEVIANCSLATQRRMHQAANPTIKIDETKLYDILHELEQNAA